MMNESTYCNMKKPIITVSFLLNSKLLIFLELKKSKLPLSILWRNTVKYSTKIGLLKKKLGH